MKKISIPDNLKELTEKKTDELARALVLIARDWISQQEKEASED